MKGDGLAAPAPAGEENVGAGQGGMATEGDLGRGGEPAQLETILHFHQEGGFGEIVLSGDGLQKVVGEPGFEDADGGRIAGEGFAGKSVDLLSIR
jgi:hypothetical protein